MFWITFFRGFIFGQNAKGRGAYKRKKGGDSWEDFIYYCGHVALTETRGGLSQNSRAETVEGAKRCKRNFFGLLCIKIEEAHAIWHPTFSRKTNKLRIPLRGQERGSLIPWPT